MGIATLFNQMDARWRTHVLGWGGTPGTIGAFGCYDTVCAMIAWACGLHYYPSTFDVLATLRKIFLADPTGTNDFLPDNALDLAFPGHFRTTSVPGFNAAMVLKARSTPHFFAYLHVAGWSPFWGMSILTHYVLSAGAGPSIVDPEGGVVRLLSAYGGPANVERTYLVEFLDPGIAAAAAAAAKASAAAAAAAAAVIASAAKEKAAQTAAAQAQAAAQTAAARASASAAAAQAAAAQAAAQAAVDAANAAATAKGNPLKRPTVLPSPAFSWQAFLLTILHALGLLR